MTSVILTKRSQGDRKENGRRWQKTDWRKAQSSIAVSLLYVCIDFLVLCHDCLHLVHKYQARTNEMVGVQEAIDYVIRRLKTFRQNNDSHIWPLNNSERIFFIFSACQLLNFPPHAQILWAPLTRYSTGQWQTSACLIFQPYNQRCFHLVKEDVTVSYKRNIPAGLNICLALYLFFSIKRTTHSFTP